MEYQKAIQAVNQGQLHANYALFGTESYLRQQMLDAILGQLGDADAFDASRFDLNDTELSSILDEADSFSFFAKRRVVIVDNAQLLVASTKYKVDDASQKRLLAYLAEPNPASIVIWLMETNQLDKRKKISKAFQKESRFVEMTPLSEKDLIRFVQHVSQDQKLGLSRQVLAELLIRVNYQLTLAMAEINKLSQYALSGQAITLEVVRQLVPRSLETDVFELSNAVLKRDISRAVQIYHDLILAKNDPIALHALLVSQFRLLIQVKLLSQAGYMEGDIAARLGQHPYRVKLALQSAQAMSLAALQQFYDILAETDYELKTGIGIKDAQFDLLMTKFMQVVA